MIKLINYKKYASKKVFISKAMIHSMQREDDITNITMEGGGGYTVKETPEEILAMPDIEEGSNTIDWEQRRYEIAIHILSQSFTLGRAEDTATNAVYYAEALIEELKKGGKK